MDSTMTPKIKTTEGKGVTMCFLVRNTFGVEAMLEFWDETRKIDKQVNYSHELVEPKQQVD